jgi:hypothetical protein
VSVNPIAGLDAEVSSLASELSVCDAQNNPITMVPDSLKNDIIRSHYKIFIGLNINYKIGKFKINASLPVSYNQYRSSNHFTTNNHETINKFYLEPSLDMQYVLSQKTTLGAKSFLYNNMNDIQELYNGYILQTYRYLNRYDGRLSDFGGNSQSFTIAYKDIIKTANLNVAYITNASQQIRQDALVDYRNDQLSASIRFSAVPASWMIVSYEGKGSQSNSRIVGGESFEPIRSFTNTANMDFKLWKTRTFICMQKMLNCLWQILLKLLLRLRMLAI